LIEGNQLPVSAELSPAQKGLYAIVAWYALVGTAVAAMAIAMFVRDASTDVRSGDGDMSVLGAALVAVAVLLNAPLLRRRGGALGPLDSIVTPARGSALGWSSRETTSVI
jgi:hypothetical protein